jgi:flagellar protein FlaG
LYGMRIESAERGIQTSDKRWEPVTASRETLPAGERRPHPGQALAEQTADLATCTERLNKTAEACDIKLRFKLEHSSGKLFVYVVDVEEGRVIRRIPPESLLEAAARVEKMVGLILDIFI